MKRLFSVIVLSVVFAAISWAGTVQKVSGDVMADFGKGWVPVKVGMKIPNKTDLMTGFDSSITIRYDAGEFVVQELSQVTFKEKSNSKRVDNELALKLGRVRVKYQKLKSRKQTSFKVTTPRGSASVRGTEEEVVYFPDFGMQVRVLLGHVDAFSQTGMRVAVRQGGSAQSGNGLIVKGTVDQIKGHVQGEFASLRNRGQHTLSPNEVNSLIDRIFHSGSIDKIINDTDSILHEPERL